MRAVEITQTDVRELDKRQIAGINDVRNATWAQVLPHDPPTPPEELEADLKGKASYEQASAWTAEIDGEVVGACLLYWTTRAENRERGTVELDIHPRHQRNGVGSALLREAASHAPSVGLARLAGWVSPSAGGPDFCEHLGIRPESSTFQGETTEHGSRQNRLYLDKVDRSLLDLWVARAAERASDYRLEFWEGPSADEDLPSLARVAQAMNTAPHADGVEDTHYSPEELRDYEQEVHKSGWIMWTMAARHLPSGEFGGYTTIYPPRFRPIAYQEDTGVLPEHRGRGLGRWLKAAMLLKLIDKHPETLWMETWNAPTNAPMLKINHELGFQAVATFVKYGASVKHLTDTLTLRS